MKKTFKAFSYRNYTLFFLGQSTSQIGTWMQRTAVSWVIYSLTKSSFMLGITVFAQLFPSFVLTLFGGIVADRHSRYKILLVTQTASMIQAILLAALILTKHYAVWEILTLTAILGVINAFDVPARQPMVHEMVPNKEDIPNALAMNSAMVNIARAVGPALSGIILQMYGAAVCFSLNALSFVAVLASLLLMKLPPFQPPVTRKKVWHELEEGFEYIRNTRTIGLILLLLASLSITVLPYDTIIPVFAKVVFRGDAATYGYITSLIGVGSILGTLFLASVKKESSLFVVLLGCTVVLGVGLILFSQANSFLLSRIFAVILGFGSLTPMTACITILQTEAAANMRGRVMSYTALGFFGMIPLGSLAVGAFSERFGAQTTVLCQGILAISIAGVFFPLLVKKPQTIVT